MKVYVIIGLTIMSLVLTVFSAGGNGDGYITEIKAPPPPSLGRRAGRRSW